MKLKALKPQVGSYGSVDTNGVIEIESEAQANALKATGNWVDATDADLAAAKARQERFVADATAMPVGPRFAAVGGTLAEPIAPPAVQAAEAIAEDAAARAASAGAQADAAKKLAARTRATAEVEADRAAEVDARLAEGAAEVKAAAKGAAAPGAGTKPASQTQ